MTAVAVNVPVRLAAARVVRQVERHAAGECGRHVSEGIQGLDLQPERVTGGDAARRLAESSPTARPRPV